VFVVEFMEFPSISNTSISNTKVPLSVGVPDKIPDSASRESPKGKEPITTSYSYGAIPPEAENVNI
jgi:hypothetical protein